MSVYRIINGVPTPVSGGNEPYEVATTTENGLMSSIDKVKLDGIAIGAEVNVQSDWTQTDDTLDDFIKNKPISLSQFTNDTGFITNTVNDLTNYYLKTETYTQTEVNTLISNIVTFNIEVVDSLPTEDISTHTIYLVSKTGTTTDVYNEYIYVNDGWELIGNTSVDLSQYRLISDSYSKTEIDTLLLDKADTGSIPTKTSDLTNDSNFISDTNYVHTDNNLTTELKNAYDGAVIDSHTHSNKAVLDAITASFTLNDKNKLDSIEDNANNYSLPFASSTNLGGVKVDGTTITAAGDGVISANYSGENLLDNYDFAINQRGGTSYSDNGVYTVDRWFTVNAAVTVNDGYLTIAAPDATTVASLRQKISRGAKLSGKTITASVECDLTTDGSRITLQLLVNGAWTPAVYETQTGRRTITRTFTLPDEIITDIQFAIMLSAPTTAGVVTQLKLYSAKIELGSAATQIIPPDPAQELAKCQRYYQIRSTNDIAAVDLRPTMRVAPTDIVAVTGGYAYIAEL